MIVNHCISREVWEQRIRFAYCAKLSSIYGQKGIIIYSVYFMFVCLLVCGSILICKLYAYVWMFLLGNYYIYAKVRLSYDVKTFKRFFFQKWDDETIAWDPRTFKNITYTLLHSKTIWYPRPHFRNTRHTIDGQLIEADFKGRCHYRVHFTVSLNRAPFQRVTLQLQVGEDESSVMLR